MSIQRQNRLRCARDFAAVRENGVRINCGPFIFNALQNVDGPVKVAVIASRRVGNAVIRNLVKRRVRAIFRRFLGEMPAGMMCVVVARSSIVRFEFDDLCRRFEKALNNFRCSLPVGG